VVRIFLDDMSGHVWIGTYMPPVFHYSIFGAQWIGRYETALLRYIQRELARPERSGARELLVPANFARITQPLVAQGA
jgi:hypothetical protein